ERDGATTGRPAERRHQGFQWLVREPQQGVCRETLERLGPSLEMIFDGINDAGQVVGSYTDGSGVEHGFLYSGGSFTTLNVPSNQNTFPRGISNSGQIVGYYGGGPDGSSYRGFLYGSGIYT